MLKYSTFVKQAYMDKKADPPGKGENASKKDTTSETKETAGAANSWKWDSGKAGWGGVGAIAGGTGLYLLGRLIHGKKKKRAPWLYALGGALAGGAGAYYWAGNDPAIEGTADGSEKSRTDGQASKVVMTDAEKKRFDNAYDIAHLGATGAAAALGVARGNKKLDQLRDRARANRVANAETKPQYDAAVAHKKMYKDLLDTSIKQQLELSDKLKGAPLNAWERFWRKREHVKQVSDTLKNQAGLTAADQKLIREGLLPGNVSKLRAGAGYLSSQIPTAVVYGTGRLAKPYIMGLVGADQNPYK